MRLAARRAALGVCAAARPAALIAHAALAAPRQRRRCAAPTYYGAGARPALTIRRAPTYYGAGRIALLALYASLPPRCLLTAIYPRLYPYTSADQRPASPLGLSWAEVRSKQYVASSK